MIINRTHLSRLTLKRKAADVAPLLQDLMPENENLAMGVHHRLLWTVFEGSYDREAKSANFLWRHMDANDQFIVLGPPPRDQSPWFKIETKMLDVTFHEGQKLAFQLRVNATVNRMVSPEKRREGRMRCDIVMDAMHKDEQGGASRSSRRTRRHETVSRALSQWMARQGEMHGFSLEALDLQSCGTVSIPRPARKKPVQLGVSDVTGVLQIRDPGAFFTKLQTGFGRSKAFGCGLMLVRPA